MFQLQTERLVMQELSSSDAAFLLELLNSPGWLQYIGDKGIRTVEAAEKLITSVYEPYYKQHGFGFWLVSLKENNEKLGISGIIKRDGLEDIDLGFAFLPQYHGKGYAYEAAAETMNFAKQHLHLKKLAAITSIDNQASIQLLEKLGFTFDKLIQLPNDEEILNLYSKVID